MARVHQRCSHEHGPIWYNEHDDNECDMCPLCCEKARADALAQQLQEAEQGRDEARERHDSVELYLKQAERTAAIYRTALRELASREHDTKHAHALKPHEGFNDLCPTCIAHRALDEAAKEQ